MNLTLGKLSASSGRLAQDCATSRADHDSLGMRKHGGDLVTSRALDVHEVTVWMLHQALKLVLAFLLSGQWMK